MPEKRRQNLAEIERGSYYNQSEWEEEILDDKGSESDDGDNDDENANENVEADVLQNRCS